MGAYGGRGPEILGVSWALMIVTTIILVARTYVRFVMNKTSAGSWALFWAYVTWVCGVVGMACISVSVHYGYGNHLEIVLEHGDIVKAGLFNWIWASFSSMMIVFAKFSVVAFLLDIQGPTYLLQKYIMLVLVGVSCVLNIITVFLIWFQCTPSAHLWNPEVKGTCPLVQANFDVSTLSGSWGAVADLYLALYPVVLVYRLQINTKLKLILGSLMGLGVFTAICSVLKTYELKGVTESEDPTYDAVPLVLWGIAESWVVLIASGIPAIWPLIRKWLVNIDVSGGSRFFSTIFLRSLLSPRGSARGSDKSGSSAHSASATHAQSTQAGPFSRLGSRNGSYTPSAQEAATGSTKGFAVQQDSLESTSDEYHLSVVDAGRATNGIHKV